MENINNLGLDAYDALYPEPRTMPPHTIISDSDTDDELELERATRPVFRTPPVQQPVTPAARPVQQPARPVQQPARPVTQVEQLRQRLSQNQRDEFRRREFARIYNEVVRRRRANESEDVVRAYSDTQIYLLNAQFPALPAAQQPVQNPVARPVQQPVPRHERPVQERRRSTYAYDKLVQNELLVQTLRGQGMVVRYDRLNDRFIRVSDNTVYSTLNRASAAHALEVGLSTTPNAWTTFKRLNGSSIDNL